MTQLIGLAPVDLVDRAATLADAAELVQSTQERLARSGVVRYHLDAVCLGYVVRLLNQLAEEARTNARRGGGVVIARRLYPVALRAVCVLSLLSLLALLPGCESAPLVHPSPGVTCTPDGDVCWRTRAAPRQCPPEGPLPRPLPQ